jgi:hypothetical protein
MNRYTFSMVVLAISRTALASFDSIGPNGINSRQLGLTGADGNEDGIVDTADYVIWRKQLAAGTGSANAVPEPSYGLLLAACLLGKFRRYRTHTLPAF